jgi:lipid-A-disaccharide synthase
MVRRRLLISTGEVSGDLQGSLLIQTLIPLAQQRGIELEILALGGDRMAAAGATLLAHTSRLGAIGFFESLPYVAPMLSTMRRVRAALIQQPPDLVVLIDYPGVNVGLARYLKQQFNCPIIYYIAPQEWAWALSAHTTQQVVKWVDEILAIFPKEAEHYAKFGAKTTWVGHPFLDQITQTPSRGQAREVLGITTAQTAIALLPASRPQELKQIWPVIAGAAQHLQAQNPQIHFWIPVALESYRTFFLEQIQAYGLRATLTQDSQLTIAAADLVIGKSGTANLEAALLNVPQIVLYRLHPISGWFYGTLLRFKVPYISPVNLIPMQDIVPELLQDKATPGTIVSLAQTLLDNEDARIAMLNHYQLLRKSLGKSGVLQRVANAVLDNLVEN